MTQPMRLELPTSFRLGTVNVYLFTGPEPVLVDTGLKSEESWAALIAGLAKYGLSVADIERVIITHPHVDHYGQAAEIALHSQAEIWIAEPGAGWLRDSEGHWQRRIAYYREVFFPGTGLAAKLQNSMLDYMRRLALVSESAPAGQIKTFAPDETLSFGGQSWQAIPAPGHAPAQTCFYQAESRQLLSADMLLPKTPPPVREAVSEGETRQSDLAQFLESLERIEALEIEQVYPGHGDPFDNSTQVIHEQRDRIQQRQAQCLHLVNAGYQTMARLLPEMYTYHLPEMYLNGLWMLAGYLDLLEAKGLIQKQAQAGVWYYECVEEECQ